MEIPEKGSLEMRMCAQEGRKYSFGSWTNPACQSCSATQTAGDPVKSWEPLKFPAPPFLLQPFLLSLFLRILLPDHQQDHQLPPLAGTLLWSTWHSLHMRSRKGTVQDSRSRSHGFQTGCHEKQRSGSLPWNQRWAGWGPESAVGGERQGPLIVELQLRPLLQKMGEGGIDAMSTSEEATQSQRGAWVICIINANHSLLWELFPTLFLITTCYNNDKANLEI